MEERLRAELLGGGGARVDVVPLSPASGPWSGWWQVNRGEFFIATGEPASGGAVLAELAVHLPSGARRFAAWLRPGPAGRWQVLAERRLRAPSGDRLAVDLAGWIGPSGEEPRAAVLIRDVGRSGVGLLAGVQLRAAEVYDLRFAGPPGEWIGTLSGRPVGQVSGSDPYRYGLRLEVPAPLRERLRGYLFALRGARTPLRLG